MHDCVIEIFPSGRRGKKRLTFDQSARDGSLRHAELQTMALHERDSRIVKHAQKFDRFIGTVTWQFIHDFQLGLLQTLANTLHCNIFCVHSSMRK